MTRVSPAQHLPRSSLLTVLSEVGEEFNAFHAGFPFTYSRGAKFIFLSDKHSLEYENFPSYFKFSID